MAKRVKFPTYKLPVGRGRLFARFTYDMPFALVKLNDEWFTIKLPSQELLRVAQNWYLGGYVYELTDAEAADLPPEYVEEI